MRLILRVFIFLSIVIIVWASYKLLNVYTSLKYEVEEPVAMGKQVSELLKEKEHYLKDLIFWLWLIIVTQIADVIILFKVLAKSKLTNL